MSAKQRSFDMIQRTLIITLYILMINILTFLSKTLLNPVIGAIVEVFLFSYLHAYYCYEYKTAAMEVEI